jgi:hypothetical protein
MVMFTTMGTYMYLELAIIDTRSSVINIFVTQ